MTQFPCVHVVDDDASIRRAIATMLEGMNVPIVEYPSANEFVSLCTAESRGCAILDQDMAETPGRELQRWMLGNDVWMPAILLSGRADVDVAVDSLKDGAIDFIRKPLEAPRLIEVVRFALHTEARDFVRQTQAASVEARLSALSSGERAVLEGMVVGTTYKELADQLGISYKTVEARRAKVLQKMQVRNAAELTKLILDFEFATTGRYRTIGVFTAIAAIQVRRAAERRKLGDLSNRSREAIRASHELLNRTDPIHATLNGE